jgi:hypothetical protein
VVEGDGLEIRCIVYGTEGSNPSLSDSLDYFLVESYRHFRSFGEVSEWSMVHAWKACVLEGTGGSNPPLSVCFPVNRFCAMHSHPTPSGPEGSSGK